MKIKKVLVFPGLKNTLFDDSNWLAHALLPTHHFINCTTFEFNLLNKLFGDVFKAMMTITMTILGFWSRADMSVDDNVLQKHSHTYLQLHTLSIFNPEDGDNMFLQNVSIYV
jgi:hypothetical protein